MLQILYMYTSICGSYGVTVFCLDTPTHKHADTQTDRQKKNSYGSECAKTRSPTEKQSKLAYATTIF